MDKRKKLKFRNILVFCACCLGWIFTPVIIGENVALVWLLMFIFSTIAIWQLNLSEGKTTTAVLIFLLIDIFAAASVGFLINGHVEQAIMNVVGFAAFIIGGPLLFIGIFILISDKEVEGGELVKSKDSPEQREKMRIKSYGCAKRAIIMVELFGLTLKQMLVAGVLALVAPIGVFLLGVDTEKTNFASEAILLYLDIVCIGGAFSLISLLWWLIECIRFNKLCHRIGYNVEEHAELSPLINQENLNRNDVKKLEDKEKYLLLHNQKLINLNIFKVINKCGLIIQILITLGIYVSVLV